MNKISGGLAKNYIEKSPEQTYGELLYDQIARSKHIYVNNS
jgi:hypothetical protein